SAKAKSENKLASALLQINFSGERDVAIFRTGIDLCELEVLRKVLPTVRCADESRRTIEPGHGTAERERALIALREQHWYAFVVAHPSRVAAAEVRQVWREQCIKAIVGKLSLERNETHLLKNYVAIWIGENFLLNAVAALRLRILELVNRDARLNRQILKRAVALFFGEI